MIRLPLFIIVLLALTSQAAAAGDWQLDILVFERDAQVAFDPSKSGHFQELNWPAMLAIDQDAGVPLDELTLQQQQSASSQGIHVLPASASSLRRAARRLNSSGRYKVLTEHSIRLRKKTTSPPMRLHDGEVLRLLPRTQRPAEFDSTRYWQSAPDLAPPIDAETLFGWFQLSHDIHPILRMDISYLRTAPGVFPLDTSPGGAREYYRDQVSQFRLKAERMLRNGKMAYFDHPRLGVLARLTNLDQAPAQSGP